MTNTVKKIRPLAVLAVLMAFFLTSCDAVLETFYPEFKDGGKLATQTFDFTLNYDRQLDGKVFIKLVPYEFNALAQKDVAKPDDATGTSFTSGGFNDPANSGVFSTQLSVLPGKKYRLVAYLEGTAGSGKPNTDFSKAQLISVNYQDLFTSDDVKAAKSSGMGISGNLFTTSYMPSGVYYELFASSDSTDAWWVDGPQNIDIKNDPNRTSADYSLKRPFSYSLGAISQVSYTITGPGGIYSSGYANVSNQTSDQFSLGSGDPAMDLQFNQVGDYNITASYWNSGDNVAGTASGSANYTVHVTDSTGVDTSSEFAGGTFNVTVNASSLSGYGYAYYVDPLGNWNYLGYMDSSTTSINASSYYTPSYNGWQPGKIVVDTYDTSWNFTGEFSYDNFTLPSNYAGDTVNVTVTIGAQVIAKADWGTFQINIDLNQSAYPQFAPYNDIYVLVYNSYYGSWDYYASETISVSGSNYTLYGIGANQEFTYLSAYPETVYFYSTDWTYLGYKTIPALNSTDTSFTISDVNY